MDWAKTIARGDEKHLRFGIWCGLYSRFDGISETFHHSCVICDIYDYGHTILSFWKLRQVISYKNSNYIRHRHISLSFHKLFQRRHMSVKTSKLTDNSTISSTNYPDYHQRKIKAPHWWPFVSGISTIKYPLCGTCVHIMSSFCTWNWLLWLPAWWALWLPWWTPAGCNNALMYLLIFTMSFCYCFIVVFCWK